MPVAIPAIAAIIVGLFGLLIYYGADKLGKVIIAWTPDIHIPGLPGLKSLVRAVVTGGVDLVQSIMYPLVHPIIKFIGQVAAWIAGLIGAIVHGIPAAAAALHRLATLWLPAHLAALRHWTLAHIAHLAGIVAADIAHTRSWVLDHLDGVRHWTRGIIAAAVAGVLATVHELRVSVWAGIHAARHLTRSLVHSLATAVAADLAAIRTWTAQRILGVEHELATAVAGVEHDIAKAVATAESFATTAALDAAGDVRGLITDGVTAVAGTFDGLITDDIPALLGVIATDFPDIGALIRSIDLTDVTDFAGVLAIEGVMARVLTRYLRECGLPNCRNLGGLGRFIQDLLSAGSMAALLAVLVAMIEDPEGTARETAEVVGPIFREAAGLARSVVGV